MPYAPTYPTIWPPNYDPDNPNTLANIALIREANESLQDEPFHEHTTGQITISIAGMVGVVLETGISAIPTHCAAWVPPGVKHSGHLGRDSTSIYLNVNKDLCTGLGFPKFPTRYILNNMTFEMMKHLALKLQGACPPHTHEERLVHVALEEVALSKQLPLSFAPLPEHPVLRRLAEDMSNLEVRKRTNANWAKSVGMSERTLSRLVVKETGLSFAKWRVHLTLMDALTWLNNGVPVTEVAHRAGYETPSAFIEAFKRVFGITPGAFRARLG